MKCVLYVLFCCFLAISACAQKSGLKPIGYINDFTQLFSESERKSLDSLVRAFERETTAEIVVVTVDSSFAPRNQFDNMVTALHNEWGVGKKDKNNGILMVICKGYRKLRISNGYGIEAKLTGEETKRIIDTIITPEYRRGRFYEGTINGIKAVMKEIR